jgi:hypothetical protein
MFNGAFMARYHNNIHAINKLNGYLTGFAFSHHHHPIYRLESFRNRGKTLSLPTPRPAPIRRTTKIDKCQPVVTRRVALIRVKKISWPLPEKMKLMVVGVADDEKEGRENEKSFSFA